MRELFEEFSKFKTTTFALVFLACLLAGIHSGLNSERAAHGCGEYSPKFDIGVPIGETMLLLLGSYVVVFFIEKTWSNPVARTVSFLVNLGYVLFIIYALIHDYNTHYAPCDRKGDESTEAIYMIGMVILPILWFGLFVFGCIFKDLITFVFKHDK